MKEYVSMEIGVIVNNPGPFLETFGNPMEYPNTHVVGTTLKVPTISVSMET